LLFLRIHFIKNCSESKKNLNPSTNGQATKKKKKELLKVKDVPEDMRVLANGIGIDPGLANQITATDVSLCFVFFLLPLF
jgi:hypothetical protein